MTFTVAERLMLLNILPAEGDITTLRLLRKLREALSFSEEEHKALQIIEDGAHVTWKHSAEGPPKEIEIGPKALTIITDTLTTLSNQHKLRDNYIELYDRFHDAEDFPCRRGD